VFNRFPTDPNPQANDTPMPTELNEQDRKHFRSLLEARRKTLLDETREILLEQQDEHFVDLAGRVHDLEEESVADLLVDLHIADMERHIDELYDIENALRRIEQQTYGECVDCSVPIDKPRLEAYPTAKRCLPCQQRHEQTHAGNRHPTL